jgi:hypothetical protein
VLARLYYWALDAQFAHAGYDVTDKVVLPIFTTVKLSTKVLWLSAPIVLSVLLSPVLGSIWSTGDASEGVKKAANIKSEAKLPTELHPHERGAEAGRPAFGNGCRFRQTSQIAGKRRASCDRETRPPSPAGSALRIGEPDAMPITAADSVTDYMAMPWMPAQRTGRRPDPPTINLAHWPGCCRFWLSGSARSTSPVDRLQVKIGKAKYSWRFDDELERMEKTVARLTDSRGFAAGTRECGGLVSVRYSWSRACGR